ncbi:MAG: response regulator [Chitinispirillaceae bacterium]|nr:response regulator [Chitinispirillaceae bacterium]
MRILIIDDSRMARYVLVRLLHNLGYKDVVAVESAEEGLRRLQTGRCDLILLDWYLGGMSGLDFLRRIREHPETRHIAVVMVTTMHERTNVIQALKAGVQGYFFKPVTAEMIEPKLREIESKIASATGSNATNSAG